MSCSDRVAYRIVDEPIHKNMSMQYLRLCCDNWPCKNCGPRKKMLLSKAIKKAVIKYDLTRFLTLTIDPESNYNTELLCNKIMAAWKKFRVHLGRDFSSPTSYIWVLELTESGIPHLHILLDRYIHKSWIYNKWCASGGGIVTKMEHINESEISRTVNYLLKQFTSSSKKLPVGRHRYQTSRNIKLKKPRIRKGWKFTSGTIESHFEKASNRVTSIKHDENGKLIYFEKFLV